MHWVADLALIHEEMAYVDERYLDDRPPRNIAAFAVFRDLRDRGNKSAMHSSIKVTRVADDHSWEFLPAIGAVKQALAFGVTAEMTLPQTDVREDRALDIRSRGGPHVPDRAGRK